MTGVRSLCLPERSLSRMYDNIPKTIPSAILYVNGIIMIVMKEGIASLKSSKLMFKIGDIIKKPTNTKAGVVAAAGTIRKIGAKNSAKKNIPATVNEVNPVRPPSDTPDALST